VKLDELRTEVFRVPTDRPEADGTFEWSATTVVLVEARAQGLSGLGFTYASPAAAVVVHDSLEPALRDRPLEDVPGRWLDMVGAVRNVGRGGIAATAISAVDVALWDLKARLLGVALVDLLPRHRDEVPIYGSGGFCNYSSEQLRDQVREWVGAGFRSMKIKVGRDKRRDPDRVELVRQVAGPEVELMVDGNGAYAPQEALEWARRFRELGVTYFEEPLSSQDLGGLAELRSRAPAGLAVAAGEYGWNLPYFHQMLEAGAVHILQADVTRCGGITNMLRVDGLCKARNMPFSAHCAPAISAHACCAMETVIHIEYFFDHYRIESMLFEGTLDPAEGLLTPDRSRPGLGLELKRDEAARYAVGGGE
jgi:L-alanine-DL-glutamate epimerase-like enolase superfamily enzyme